MAAPIAVSGFPGNMLLLLRVFCRPRSLHPFVALSICCPRPFSASLGSLSTEAQIIPSSPSVLRSLSGLNVQHDFVSPEEEETLLVELEPVLRRKRYETGHWDEAIHGFRETERLHWSPQNSTIIQRVREKVFAPGEEQLSLVHVLDLKKDGYIKAHVDSVKFCGSTIAGICLLSASIMRLVSVDNQEERADLLLPRRCLYVLSGLARYNFTHEILRDEESIFNGERIPRERRISVICRNLPPS
ncbi:alpha-ketoglutarate-dependent dioxygenase alkB homolog 7, mitochondrial [Bombina bombina]|uniref:alpha-ketoglutarate-dependent dioxygenase alkB homolog 7, mitochondrial n=1 Tax=Bombina bombina TaxID=8345 RepID=UPI00235B1206|nr:alpha-ketoglutarate-dependent dioxygenase alkB homolog 7, mitochondrial [Bombina bombina]